MTVRQMMQFVATWGALTVVAQLVGPGDVGGVLALIHLGGLIGAPLAMILNRQLRSVPATIAMAMALSIALSALAVQSLVWFGAATRILLVITGTAYGLALAWLLTDGEASRPSASHR